MIITTLLLPLGHIPFNSPAQISCTRTNLNPYYGGSRGRVLRWLEQLAHAAGILGGRRWGPRCLCQDTIREIG
jgi:hypothetical protein